MPVALALIPAGLQTVGGIAQSIFGAVKEHKATKALENLQTPTYSANKSIMDYYNKSLQRYGINPYQSEQYNYATQGANRSMAAGIGALQDRRSAVGSIGRLTAINNDANLRAGITAQQQQAQNLSQLGSATGMKAADDRYGFQINSIMPYEKQYSLLAQKASGGAQMVNAGLGNIFSGLSSAGKVLGGDKDGSNKTTTEDDYTPTTLPAPPASVNNYLDPYLSTPPQEESIKTPYSSIFFKKY